MAFFTNTLKSIFKDYKTVLIVGLLFFSLYQHDKIQTTESVLNETAIELKLSEEALRSMEMSYTLLQETFSRQAAIIQELQIERESVKDVVTRKILELKDMVNEEDDGSISPDDFNRLYNELCTTLFPERCLHPVLPDNG